MPRWTDLFIALLLLAQAGCAVGPPRRQAAPPASPPPVLTDAASLQERYAQALDLMQRRQDVEATAMMQELAQTGHVGPQVNLGILLARQGQDLPAIAALQGALARAPGLASASHWLASLLRQQGRALEAESVLLQALRRDAENPATHRNLAILYERELGQPERALAHYRQYRALGGEDTLIAEAWIRQLQDAPALHLAGAAP